MSTPPGFKSLYHSLGIKEVGGVAQTGVDIGADPDVPLGGILADGVVILRTVDLDLDADLLERSLRGLGQQRQLLTGRVGQPADGQLLSVLLADAVAVRIDPAGLLQNGLGLRGIIGDRIDALAEGKAVGEGAGRGIDSYLDICFSGTCLHRINDSHFFPCHLIHSIIGQHRGHC